MKKIIMISILLLTFILQGCTKVKQYEDFDTYQELDVIFEEWRENRDSYRYFFIDCRSTSNRKKSCHPYFDYAIDKGELNNILRGAKENSPIILMGQNEEDQKPYEYKKYLSDKGYTNIVIYITGFENYLTNPDFTPKTNCATDCGCN